MTEPDDEYYDDEPEDEPELVRPDRLAIAIGNASLLGVGYLMLGRRAWAIGTGLVTLVFAVLLGTAVPTVWFELVFVLWWAVLIAHGWLLAGKPARRAAKGRRRLAALFVTVPVLAGITALRFEAASIEAAVDESRDSGDCGTARSALDRMWFGHNVVDAPMAVRSERTAQACERLVETKRTLNIAALTRDTRALQTGYEELSAVLRDFPGHDRMVGAIADGFLHDLSGKNPCDIAEVTDWLRKRPASHDLLDRSVDIVPKIAPAALVGCGDAQLAKDDWNAALARFQQLLAEYPGHELTAKAHAGVKKAVQGLELVQVYTLAGKYCDAPVAYSGATPYTKGATNPGTIYGAGEYLKSMPADWKAKDVGDAVLIVCLGTQESGAVVKTCSYEGYQVNGPTRVTFSKITVPVRAYEVRTGKLVVDTKVVIGGSVCPPTITYPFNTGPFTNMSVTPAEADVRAAFAPVFTP